MTDLDTMLLARHVDRLMVPWAKPGTPGVAVGVIKDGALVLHRCAGLASLELGVPVGPDTCFRIASVSKQFTCTAVLMLAREGRVDIEAEARRYLPELPDFGVSLTIAHLMHNVSGLRDMLEIMRQGGVDLSWPVTSEQILAGILRQRTLNFPPGSRYLYSNSGFLLLGMIIERVSGMTLPDFLQQRIFTPLGMTRTRMTPNVQEVVPGLASGYLPNNGAWIRAAHAFPIGGEGGLVSCVEDLALWDRNFTSGRVGGGWLGAELTRQTEFSGGGELGYARGLAIRSHRGLRTVSHGGLWPGYKTEFLRCPERGVTVICITNNGGSDPYHLAHDILDVIVEGTPGVHPVPPMPARPALEAMVGRWLDAETGQTVEISLTDSGQPMGSTNGVPFRLKPGEDGRLEASRSARDFTCALQRDDTLAVEFDAGVRASFRRVPPGAALPDGLPGRYANAEIGAIWTIAEGPEGLQVHVDGPVAADSGGWPVEAVQGDIVRFWVPGSLFRGWLDVRVLRKNGAVTGLGVTGNRARRLVYRRLSEGEAA